MTKRKTLLKNLTTGWSPESVSTELWLDASDPTTVERQNGLVTQWSDKSGNANHVYQDNYTYRPEYSPSFSGIRFNGENNRLQGSIPATLTSYPFSVFVVAFNIIQPSTFVKIGSDDGCGLGGGSTSFNDYGPNVLALNEQKNWLMTVEPLTTSGTIIAAEYDGTYEGINLYQFGNLLSYGPATGYVPLTPSGDIFIGGYTVPWDPGSGITTWFERYSGVDLAEIIITAGILSASERQKMEGYLAHKWGLETGLPVSHPYRAFSP